MKRLIGIGTLCILFIILAAHEGSANTSNLFGIVYHNNRAPAVNQEVFVSSDGSTWQGPSITDGFGRFAFLNIPAGNYFVKVPAGGHDIVQQVQVPGAAVVITLDN